MKEKQANEASAPSAVLGQLKSLHRALLTLHKALLDSERAAYEKANGPIPGTGRLLELVMSDPFFDWLHQISGAIVKIDEITEAEAFPVDEANDLVKNLRRLFQTGEEPLSDFMSRYKTVLKREPAAVLAHFEVQKILVE